MRCREARFLVGLTPLLLVLAGCGGAGATWGNDSAVVTIDGRTIQFLSVEISGGESETFIHLEDSVTSYPWDIDIYIGARVEAYDCYDGYTHSVRVDVVNDAEEAYYEGGEGSSEFEVCIHRCSTKDGSFTTGTFSGMVLPWGSYEPTYGIEIEGSFSAKR